MKKLNCLVLLLFSILNVYAYDPQASAQSIVRDGNVRFTVLTPQLIRMEWSKDGQFEDNATLTFVNRKLDTPRFKVKNTRSTIEIQTKSLTLKYRKGERFSKDNMSVKFRMGEGWNTWHPGDSDSANLMGTMRTLDGANGYNKPFEKGILSRDGWALVDDSERHLLLPDDSEWGEWVSPRPKGERQDWYLFAYGHDYKQALHDYSLIAGRSPLPPKYAFGYWWSRYWQYSDNEFVDLVNEIRRHDIPIDVLIVDMDWHETWGMTGHSAKDEYGERIGWTGYTWQKELFPSPENFLKWTKNAGLKVALNIHPASGIQPYESVYENFTKEYKWTDKGKSVPFHIDEQNWTNAYFKSVMEPMERAGVDFWWIDWQQWLLSKYTPGLSNTFWLNYTFFNHAKRTYPDLRPMIYHRWGGLGSHRYQVAFSGDTYGTWETLAFLPYFTATASNVNYGYWGHDIGGHMQPTKTTNPEIYTRWLQYAVFTPIFKTHSSKTSRIERRIWKFPNHEEIMREAFYLRYRLAPYIYDAARQNYDTGIGICRPMYYDWAECDDAYKNPEEFMFGDDILATVIATPVDSITELAQRRIWFPKGEWFDCVTGDMIEGDSYHTQEYTLAENPWYARAGAVIPMNPESVRSLQQPCDTLVLTFIPGGDGELKYYEDDGKSQQYATRYATTHITKEQIGNTIHVHIYPREGSFDEAHDKRSYELQFPATFTPAKVKINESEIPYARFPKGGEWSYDGYTLSPIIYTGSQPCDKDVEVELMFDDYATEHQKDLYGKQKWFKRCLFLTKEFKFACGEVDSQMMLPVEYLRISQTPNRITEYPEQIVEILADFEANIKPMYRKIKDFDKLDPLFKKRLKAQLR